MPEACIRCGTKSCQKSVPDTLDFCEYGVAYFNKQGRILKKEEAVTLRHVSHNLRHELNKVLQTIVSEAVKIDPTVSIKSIDLNNHASKIVGATIIIDQFIEMISGVNDFHPARKYSANLEKKSNLHSILDKYSKVHSLISNTRRSKSLNITINCKSDIFISFAANIVEYIVSILFDNLWKYSLHSSDVDVIASRNKNGYIDIQFNNISKLIENTGAIFSKGYQQNESYEGFGYGLFWANILSGYYNELSGRSLDLFDVTHVQYVIDDKIGRQEFTIRNVRA